MSRATFRSTSSQFAASVPNITTLRQELDYGDPRLDRCSIFYDEIRVFRNKFTTSNGLRGKDLWDWRSREDQAGLTEMTKAFLDDGSNGLIFWPDDDASPNKNKLKYSADGPLIRRLIKQLFFRLNQQQYRNLKYKKKDQPPAGDRPKGGDVGNPIIVEDFDADAPILPKQEETDSPPLTSAAPQYQRIPPIPRSRSPINDAADLGQGDLSDPYVFRGDTEPRFVLDGSEKHGLSEDREPPSPSKRVRVKSRLGLAARGRAGGQRAKRTAEPSRISPRTRKTRIRPNYATEEQIDDALASQSTAEDQAVDPQFRPDTRPRTSPNGSTITIGVPGNPGEAMGEDLFVLNTPIFGSMIPPSDPATSRPPTRDESVASFAPAEVPSRHLPARSSGYSEPPMSRHSDDLASEVAKKPGPSSKPGVEFQYRVMDTQPLASRVMRRRWVPKGRFQDLTLHELLKDLALPSTVTDLLFSVEGPGLSIAEQVPTNDESSFEVMKRYFNRRVRACLAARNPSDGPLLMEMEIEPLVEGHPTNLEEDGADGSW